MEASQTRLLKEVTSFLKIQKIPYMITGAWSSIFYGRPRASHDIDFVVELSVDELEETVKSFSKLPEAFAIQLETIESAIKHKSLFQAIHLPTMLKIDFWILTEEPFDKSRFKRRKKVKVLNRLMDMASPEDTIIQKFRWFKEGKIEKHLVDAAFVYKIQDKNLDKKYLHKWIEKLNLSKYFQLMQRINLEEQL